MFDELYQQYRALIARDAILIVEGNLRFDDFVDDWRVAAKRSSTLARRASSTRAAGAALARGDHGDGKRLIAALEQALAPARGGRCAVAIRYAGEGASANVLLGDEWSVRPSQDLIERLGRLVGREGVELLYAHESTASIARPFRKKPTEQGAERRLHRDRRKRSAGAPVHAAAPIVAIVPVFSVRETVAAFTGHFAGRAASHPDPHADLRRRPACGILPAHATELSGFEQPIAELEAKIDEQVRRVRRRGQRRRGNRAAARQEPRTHDQHFLEPDGLAGGAARAPSAAALHARLRCVDLRGFQSCTATACMPTITRSSAGSRGSTTTVMLLGHQKGRDTKERVRRNYGMPKPEGYRKALRLMKLAERFRHSADYADRHARGLPGRGLRGAQPERGHCPQPVRDGAAQGAGHHGRDRRGRVGRCTRDWRLRRLLMLQYRSTR